MAAFVVKRLRFLVQNFETLLGFRRGYPDGLCLAGIEINKISENVPNTPKFSLKDIIGDGFLWAVPKHRRTIEKRLKRKYGHSDYVMKIIQPKTNLKTCNKCGDDHEAGVLCPTCYKIVMDETKEMQEAIQNELKLEPVEQDVVVLYSGENEKEGREEFCEGKRVVEMKKERPSWFTKNLLQQSVQKPSATNDVKPSELG